MSTEFPQDDISYPDRPALRPTPWGIREVALGFLFVALAYVVAATALVLPVQAAFGEDTREVRFAEVLSVTVVDLIIVAGVLWLVSRRGGDLKDLGFRTPRRPEPRPSLSALIDPPRGFPVGYTLGLAVAGLVVAYISTGLYGVLIDALNLEFLEPGEQIPEDYFEGTAVIAALGVGVVGAAPIAEELFFRGFLFQGIKRSLGLWAGALLSSLVFSMAHAQVGLIIPFTLIGLIFVYLFQRANSLWPPIAMHLFFNLISFSVLVFYPEAR